MQKTIKVVFDASPMLVNKTGVAYYTERLVQQLAARYPDEIELVGFYYNFLGRRTAGHFPKAKNIRYRPIRFIPSKLIYQLRRFGMEVPLELLSKERADFVLFTNFLGYPSLYKSPAAPVIHDLTFVDIPEYVAAKNGSDLRRFVPKQIGRSRFVVTVSEFSKRRIVDSYHVPPKDVVVTPIPPEAAKPLEDARLQQVLSSLQIKKSYILFLSTIEPRKNLISLIDAYEQLPAKLKSTYSLVVAGRIGWNCDAEVARLQKAKEQGLDVIHLGYVDETARCALFQGASLYINSSNYEGFGMPVLEAMSYSTACALSNIEVFHEVAGDSATYFDQRDTSSITGALQQVLSDNNKLEQLAKAGKGRADSYSWGTVAERLFTAIKQQLVR